MVGNFLMSIFCLTSCRLLDQVILRYEQSYITAIRPVRVVESNEIDDANRLLATGEAIAKVLVNIPADLTSLHIELVSPPLQFRSDASYLIAGGVGGLGRAISTCMVEHGA